MNMDISSIDAARKKASQWISSGHKRLLINGQWMASVDGKEFETINPATEEVLTTVAEAGAADIDKAVHAARSSFEAPSWRGISPHQRGRYLRKIADLVELHGDELAAIETLNNGVPFGISKARIQHISDTFNYYAGWSSKMGGTTNPTDAQRFIYSVREPMGVCALINAWNVPLGMAAAKIAPALATGNTALLKPAEQTPLSTLRLAELILETDLPPGVLNVVPGFGHTAGAAMSANLDIDKIAFTGSTLVGKKILEASTGNLKKVSLELGGKSPNIIFPDADLQAAVRAAVATFCRNSGQICSAGTRLFVHESIYEQVVEQVCEIAKTYQVGYPFSPGTALGPLISETQLNRVLSYIHIGQQEGATLKLGGNRIGSSGYFLGPTVFADVRNDMRIAQDEIFGPVLTILKFKDESDVIHQANQSIYGLAAAVWTKDISRAHRISGALKCGRIWINTYGEADPVMSVGGYKQSGYGREYGNESIDTYTQTKSVMLRI